MWLVRYSIGAFYIIRVMWYAYFTVVVTEGNVKRHAKKSKTSRVLYFSMCICAFCVACAIIKIVRSVFTSKKRGY